MSPFNDLGVIQVGNKCQKHKVSLNASSSTTIILCQDTYIIQAMHRPFQKSSPKNHQKAPDSQYLETVGKKVF
jgi:hypothetical protein